MKLRHTVIVLTWLYALGVGLRVLHVCCCELTLFICNYKWNVAAHILSVVDNVSFFVVL